MSYSKFCKIKVQPNIRPICSEVWNPLADPGGAAPPPTTGPNSFVFAYVSTENSESTTDPTF